ncbi:MAG: putative monocarboxylate transporter mch1 [Bathelium mastoideum]|nr:MAG: putative monocarboxylate transporter mch1 [Bathelium mastoideum]
MPSRENSIDKRDFRTRDAARPLLSQHDSAESSHRTSQDGSHAGSFFEQVAEGIQEQDRKRMRREVIRWASFAWAIVECLCAGSITAYSLYGHLFQTHLRYSQYRVNIISITAELAMYLPVPLFGFLCDRYGPAPLSISAGAVFGLGYLLAAFAYKSGPPPDIGTGDGHGWPFGVMVLAFVAVGMGTSGMYLSAVTTCAKNFGRGRHKGFALAMPIAAFGLSGMWQSQVGEKLLYETRPDGSRGDVDVHRYFLFLGCTLLGAGLIGGVALRVINEDEMIDEAVSELERSGLLEESDFFGRDTLENGTGYGTLPSDRHLSDEDAAEFQVRKQRARDSRRKKTALLNTETRRFLVDPTMWWLAAGFFLVTGPGEAFINNIGSILPTLYPAGTPADAIPTTAATHVSIVAVTSTAARILTGTLSDLLAPTPPRHPAHRRPGSATLSSSIPSLPIPATDPESRKPWYARPPTISRIAFLLAATLLLSAGQALLASGAVQQHGERLWLVSAAIGAGYGAAFSLVPIVIGAVWGVENFGTNWGVVAMVPAGGAAVWGAVFAAVYQAHAGVGEERGGGVGRGSGAEAEGRMCYGTECYAVTFWGMAVSVWVACGMWAWAWRGPGGWKRMGVAV